MFGERGDERGLIDDPTARDIDEYAARAERLENVAANERRRTFGAAGRAEKHDVALARQSQRVRIAPIGNVARDRIDIADLRLESLQAAREFDADAAEAHDPGPHPGELAARRQALGPPAAGAHESIGARDLSAARQGEGEGEISDVVEEHRSRGEHDAALMNGRKIACLQPYAVEGANLQLGGKLEMLAGQAGHAVADSAANIRPDPRERRKGIGIGVNRMDLEPPTQFLQHEGLLRADQG